MDPGLFWTAVGSAAGLLTVGLAAWQVRLQLQEHRHRRASIEETDNRWAGGLPVVVPVGRLPAEVRGRDALLSEVRHSLTRKLRRTGRTWVLAGMGGIGKSTAALAIAQTARARGWRVWWVTATDTASLTGGMLEVLYQLGAPESVILPVREGSPIAAERALGFLNGDHRAGRRWLLVFDNADTPSVVAANGSANPADGTGWVRRDPSGVVVVTTRVKDLQVWGSWITLRELRPLDDITAARVLTDLAPEIADPTSKEAQELGQRLGGLPLALHLAGSYLASPFARWNSFGAYQRALDSATFPSLLADLDGVSSQDRDAIRRTWDLSLDALTAGGQPQARPLLFLLSCYKAATPIPVRLLEPGLLIDVLDLGEESATRVPDLDGEHQRRLRDAALRGLVDVGLIELVGDGHFEDRAITVHPVVADALRSRLLTLARPSLPIIGAIATRLLGRAVEGLDHRRATAWPTWNQLSAHITALLEWLAAQLDDANLTILLEIAERATSALMRSGDVPAAERLARGAVRAAARLGDGDLANLTALGSMARVLAGQGRYEAAEQLYRQVLPGRTRVLGVNHPATLDTCQHVAWMVDQQGRHREAEELYAQVLAGRRQSLGEEHPDTLDTRRNLADTMWQQSRYVEAEVLYRQVLADYQRLLGDEHPDTLSSRRNLAGAIAGQGRHAEAENIYRQVLAEQVRVLGKYHHRTLVTRHELAETISHQGRQAEAEQLLREVLVDRQRILGENHPATLATRKALEQLRTD